MRETGGKTGLNKSYHNVHSPPLPIYAEPDTRIADLFAFPTVHVHTGIVNHLFKFIEKEFPGIVEWPNRLRLKRRGYHSKVFEVNNHAWGNGDIESKVLLGPSIPYHSMACRWPTPSRPNCHMGIGHPRGKFYLLITKDLNLF
jgi:hypothetical protein